MLASWQVTRLAWREQTRLNHRAASASRDEGYQSGAGYNAPVP